MIGERSTNARRPCPTARPPSRYRSHSLSPIADVRDALAAIAYALNMHNSLITKKMTHYYMFILCFKMTFLIIECLHSVLL